MRPPRILSLLIAAGRSGVPEIVISLYLLCFAYRLNSFALALTGALILWPGLANLWGFLTRSKPTRDDD